MARNDPCFCGSGKKQKKCHPEIHEKSIGARLLKIYNTLDQEIQTYYANHCENNICIKGCNECCYTDFSLSTIEFDLITYEIRRKSKPQIEEIINRAEKLWDIIKTKYPEYIDLLEEDSTDRIDVYYKSMQIDTKQEDFKCPFLDNSGACIIYDVRPIICRTYGVAYYDRKLPNHGITICSKIGDSLAATSWQANLTRHFDEILSFSNINIPDQDINIDIRKRPMFYYLYKRSWLFNTSNELPHIFELEFNSSEKEYQSYYKQKALKIK